tara:strand:+ start:13136 stop:14152 length:1017 start_codon:yes stop_codon:yes gene_type:complete
MKTVTEKDIVRLLDDQVEDPEEIKRIFAAMDADPRLSALFELLGDFDHDDQEISEQDRMQFPDLSRTRLCRLISPPDLEQLSEGNSISTQVEFEQSGQIKTFEIEFRRQGERFYLEAAWPSTLSPIGFVLSQFELVRERTSFVKEIELPQDMATAKEELIAPRQQERSYSAAAKTGKAESHQDSNDNSRFFHAELEDTNISVSSSVSAGRADEILMAEVEYQIAPGQKESVRFPFQLSHQPHDRLRTALIEDFPWPDKVVSKKGTLTIRPLDESDFPLFSPDLVSNLLAHENQFVAVPVMPDTEGRLFSEFCYQSVIQVASDHKTAWSLRMAEKGGAA